MNKQERDEALKVEALEFISPMIESTKQKHPDIPMKHIYDCANVIVTLYPKIVNSPVNLEWIVRQAVEMARARRFCGHPQIDGTCPLYESANEILAELKKELEI